MTVGIAVEITAVSRLTRNVATNRAIVTRRRPDTPSDHTGFGRCRSYMQGLSGSRLAQRRATSGGGGGGVRVLGQPYAHKHALAFARTAGPDAAAVLLDNIATDIQPEAHPRDLPLL